MDNNWDFGGWATRNDIRCSDGRIIRSGAFAHCDGTIVPLCWNHSHNEVKDVLGKALLETRDEGVYVYGSFNDTVDGQHAKQMVQHGDVVSLSIFANKLKEQNKNVMHGTIREVSLVLAGANPGAYIENVMVHDDDDTISAEIYFDTELDLYHKDNSKESEEDVKMAETENEKTVEDVINSMTEEQQNVLYALVGQAIADAKGESDEEDEEESTAKHSYTEEGDDYMEHNIFEGPQYEQGGVLSHADGANIIQMAKQGKITLKQAAEVYMSNNGMDSDSLAHGYTSIEYLFPEYKDVNPGAPELITRDMTWVDSVINGVTKSPYSRIRTRQTNAKLATIRGRGFKKSKTKQYIGDVNLLSRTTDPQTVYVKDKLYRDDIIDITDFDIVKYQYGIMRMALNEELAMAFMVGDGRETGAEDKIDETHIRSIWHDNDLYAIHHDVDFAKGLQELQGTDTSKHFSQEYVITETVIKESLFARENYKGSGSLTFYCTPHLVNQMLLARDMNGRRIYNNVSDLTSALNVKAIETCEQFEGLTRTTSDGKTKKLLGIFVNMKDYQVGSTKGGQITNFEDFDIDFNQYKYLMETRLSGALVKVYSAICLEEDVTEASQV